MVHSMLQFADKLSCVEGTASMTKANRPNCYFESKHRLQRRLREKQLLNQNRKPKVEISCEPLKDERDIAEGGDVEEILKYIENEEENQDSKVMDPKKAAKKARQKQRKVSLK